MSGHSKWATTHRQKEVKDAKKGQIFTKLANMITIAVRSGGGITDPDKNFKLRLAVEKARSFDMPKENIDRAIARGAGGGEADHWEEVTYEGFGPGGVAVVVETVTDNRNRTTAELKNLFERGGGSLAGPNSVSFQFIKTGLITVKKEEKPDEQMLKIMDMGVDDIEEGEKEIRVYAAPEKAASVRDELTGAGFSVNSLELVMKPKIKIVVDNLEKRRQILDFIALLQQRDDVQRVFTNFD